MVDIKNKRCQENGCIKQPNFNFKNEFGGKFCKIHAKNEMIDIVSRRCQNEKCEKSPCYNFENEKQAIFCKQHSLDGMKNIVSRRCQNEECDKIPCYNLKNEKIGIYCQSHATEGMYDIRSRRCKEDGCNIQPVFNFEDKKYGIFCKIHAQKDMKNVTIKRCKNILCDMSVTYKKYGGYCLFCFIHLFPDRPVARNYKTKEKAIGDYIKEQFSNFIWITDKRTLDGCSKRRPDLLLDLGYQVIIIEIDENQHDRYEEICENKRIMELSQDLQFRPIIFIRFNPDDYTIDNKKITSCWAPNGNGIMCVKKSKQKEWNERLEKLKETVNFWLNNQTEKIINNIYLFYDNFVESV